VLPIFYTEGSIINGICMANTSTYNLYHDNATGKDKQGKKIWTRIGASTKVAKALTLRGSIFPLGTASP
jgi:hypothetical protein